MSFERIPYGDGQLRLTGLLARPEGRARGAIAVFPTIANVTPAVEAKARALADSGYMALICDYYGGQPVGMAQAMEWAEDLRADPHAYRRLLTCGLETLRSEAGALPLAAIGFCMGGQAALELARGGADLALAASFHGLLDTRLPAQPGAVKAKILVCHGDADPLVPREQVAAFQEEMDRAGANWHFHSYAGVRHGFTNPHPVPGNAAVGYDSSADRQSWNALLSLLDEVIPQTAASSDRARPTPGAPAG